MKFKINPAQIEYLSGNSTLIRLPNNSEFKGYKFWISNKRIFRTSWYYTIYIDENSSTTIFKNGNGQWNKFEKINEKTIPNKILINQYDKQQDSIS
ncbi:hypothetical protein [Mycoplasma anserisalpingitidis]|uniref:hypothetical protein n=1 Tax=Mycoplasma anserisalpingitidis TaxID=519450 RepID=UPI0011B1AB87|nr:hypothetical protein [Mycoplasma anserisalpingitidis]QDY87724.1 hypothetical protein FOY45_02180 [Mycoplasma anserisalpingitidis]